MDALYTRYTLEFEALLRQLRKIDLKSTMIIQASREIFFQVLNACALTLAFVSGGDWEVRRQKLRFGGLTRVQSPTAGSV